MSMFIQLVGKHSRFKYAIIDEEDFDKIKGYRWRAFQSTSGVYAIANPYINKQKTTIWMHKLIMDCPNGMVVDHINGDTLQNTKDNLRVCTHHQNVINARKTSKPTTSKYKGVHFKPKSGKWCAANTKNGNTNHIGLFDSEDDAARAYDYYEWHKWGEFAKLNFPEIDYDNYTPNPLIFETTSEYYGVDWRKDRNKWRVRVKVNKKDKLIGYFSDELVAAQAYDKYVIENNLNRKLNFPEEL